MFLGGDEVDPGCFESNPRVAQWLADRRMSAAELPDYFWRRASCSRCPHPFSFPRPPPTPVVAPATYILLSHFPPRKRKVFSEVTPGLNASVGVWESDEMQIDLQELPQGSFVNVWQRPAGVARATSAGIPAVYSGAYYLDQEDPGGCHAYATQQARARVFLCRLPLSGRWSLSGGCVRSMRNGFSAYHPHPPSPCCPRPSDVAVLLPGGPGACGSCRGDRARGRDRDVARFPLSLLIYPCSLRLRSV